MVDVEDCLLQRPEAAAIAAAVRAWMADSGVPAYDEAAHSGLVRHLFLASPPRAFCAAWW